MIESARCPLRGHPVARLLRQEATIRCGREADKTGTPVEAVAHLAKMSRLTGEIGSWDSVSDCARFGILLALDGGPTSFLAYALKPASPKET